MSTTVTVTAAKLEPGMIARRGGLVLCRNPFRSVAMVSSNAPYAGRTVVFADGGQDRVLDGCEFEVANIRTMPTALDLIACVMGAYVAAG